MFSRLHSPEKVTYPPCGTLSSTESLIYLFLTLNVLKMLEPWMLYINQDE